ncbi:MAG: TRAP transporter substrate-binding protein [Clostridia bacterium]|nr:TRAP transporter substrate-binding protein [Clostridia bacterium]
MKKILATLLVLILALGLAATASAEDYGSYDWIAAMTVAETTTNYKMVEKFAQLINERSNGSISVELYPGGQLGNTTEFTEAVVAGSIDIGTGMTTDLVDFVPEMGLFDMPNLFDSIDQMRALLTSDYALNTINEYCVAHGVRMLGFSDAGFRQLTTNKRVDKLDDLNGQKIRVMTNNYHIAYWNAVGASAVPMQFGEVFMALQQNTIDGEENPYMNVVGNNIHEVQKYIVETNHLGHIITFFINNDLYESLPDNTRALVDECAAEAVAYAAEVANESIALDKQTCVDAGCEIITLSEEDLATLREKAQVVYDMVRQSLGDDKVDGLLNAIQAL